MNSSLAALAALVILLLSPVEGAQPWDSAFQPDIRSFLSKASGIASSESDGVSILLDDHAYLLRSDGRMDTVLRRVLRVENQDAVEDWSTFEQSYRPWHQAEPVLKARVINKDGSEKWFDLKTVSTAPTRQFDSTIFSDERVMRAPLPAVAPGSIIEWEVTLRDKSPLFAGGLAERVTIPSHLRTARFHLSIEAEQGLDLRIASQKIPETAIRRAMVGKNTRIELELTDIKPEESFEGNLPSNVSMNPYLAFSTGKTWQAVASMYSDIVNRKISESDLKAAMEGVNLKGSPMEVASRLTAKLHKLVRYTGVEFGEAAIIQAHCLVARPSPRPFQHGACSLTNP